MSMVLSIFEASRQHGSKISLFDDSMALECNFFDDNINRNHHFSFGLRNLLILEMDYEAKDDTESIFG